MSIRNPKTPPTEPLRLLIDLEGGDRDLYVEVNGKVKPSVPLALAALREGLLALKRRADADGEA